MATHRAWRVNVTATASASSWCTIGEISFLDLAGNTIATTSGSAIASSSYDSWTADKAFDGALDYDTGSWMPNGSAPQWCGWDFGVGNAQDVAAVVITNPNGAYYPEEYPVSGSIDYSDDGINWTTARAFSGRSTSAGLATTYDATPSILDVTEARDQVAIVAHHVPPISAILDATEAQDQVAILAHHIPPISAILDTTEAQDQVAATGAFFRRVTVTLAVTEAADQVALTGGAYAPVLSTDVVAPVQLPRLLSDPLPLRRTTELATYREDTPIPWVYGHINIKPIALDTAGLEWLIADHSIQTVESVTVGGVNTSGYQLINRIDDTGHTISTLRLTQAPKDSAEVVARIVGKRHPVTGEVIEHPADIVRDLLTECGWKLTLADLDNLHDEYPGLALAGQFDDTMSLRDAIGQIMNSIGAVWTAAPLMARKRGVATAPVATLTRRELETPAATSTATDLITILRVSYALDPSTGQPAAALTLHAPDRIDEIGKITSDLTLPWIRTARDALAIATDTLQCRTRPRWSITDTIDQPDDQAWQPGDGLTIDHPWLPSGIAEIQTLDLDPDSGRLGLTLSILAGELARVELLTRSAAIEPEASDPLKITYTNGVATFSISDDTGSPIAGAAVTLDGQITHQTDRYGAVQFKTTRGAHTLDVTASGYAPFEITVTV